MHTDLPKPTLSIAEFCAATTLGRTKVYAEIKQGRLKIVKCGRRSLIPVEELKAWLKRLGQEVEGE
jgi:excisionase family DNA binding protein